MRRLAIALGEVQPESSPTPYVPAPSAKTSNTTAGVNLHPDLPTQLPVSASNEMGHPAGHLGPTPSIAPKVPRRNVYISPFLSQQDQEEEVARVKSLMAELAVPGGTVRRVMPGKREWLVTPL